MPQFDISSFIVILFWLYLSFYSFYFFFTWKYLPYSAFLLKTRKKFQNYYKFINISFENYNICKINKKSSYYDTTKSRIYF